MTTTWSHGHSGIYPSVVCLLFLSVLFDLFPQSACAPTAPLPTQNITITVPQGTTNHGNQKLLCTPSKWTDIATFFLANCSCRHCQIFTWRIDVVSFFGPHTCSSLSGLGCSQRGQCHSSTSGACGYAPKDCSESGGFVHGCQDFQMETSDWRCCRSP